jgi:hypothetical protein
MANSRELLLRARCCAQQVRRGPRVHDGAEVTCDGSSERRRPGMARCGRTATIYKSRLSRPPGQRTVHSGPAWPPIAKFVFPDGANHVGLCQAFLFRSRAPRAEGPDWGNDGLRALRPSWSRAQGGSKYSWPVVTIPSAVPCDPAHCVLQWVWIATHRSITRPEYYNNCADLTITGAHQATVTAASPTGDGALSGM